MSCALRVYEDPEGVAAAAAAEFFSRAAAAQEERRFTCVLSGGNTPRLLFARLSGGQESSFAPAFAWDRVHFFWGDERDVPPDHPDSNYRAAFEAFLSRIPIPPENVHRMKPEAAGAVRAAQAYDEHLRHFFSLAPGRFPRFDLIFLGVGEDGHTASIFPGGALLHEKIRLAGAERIGRLGSFRISMTLPVLNNAACVVFLATGAAKAGIVRRVLNRDETSPMPPARLVNPVDGELIWLVDRAASGSDDSNPFQSKKKTRD